MADDHVSLREYVESLFKGHERRHDEMEAHRLELRDLLQRALDAVAAALIEYKSTANEWRDTLSDRDANFASKIELEAATNKVETAMGALAQRVEELRKAAFLQAGAKAQGIDFRTTLLALLAGGASVALIIGLVVRFF